MTSPVRLGAIALSFLFITGACAGTEPQIRLGFQPVGTSSEASPFTVGREPARYHLTRAGRGTAPQMWGIGDEPLTLLRRAGRSPETDMIVVSTLAFEHLPGKLAQASVGFPSPQLEAFEVEGRQAVFMPATSTASPGRTAEVLLEKGPNIAVRVRETGATKEDLVEIAQAVQVAEDTLVAPTVPTPPSGLEVVGSADADVATVLKGGEFGTGKQFIPSSKRGYVAVWVGPDPDLAAQGRNAVTVATLPGQALDLDALRSSAGPLHGRPSKSSEIEVSGQRGLLLQYAAYDNEGPRTVMASSTSWGDLLLLFAWGGDPPELEELEEMAGSVRRASNAEWAKLVEQSRAT